MIGAVHPAQHGHTAHPGDDDDAGVRLRAGVVSLVVSLALLGAKYQAYRLTGSTAILSDALESIVNVVAAVFAVGGLVFAGRPADRNHPYGHGKIEFFSAAFEGGLIAFAAVVILYEAGLGLLAGIEVRDLDTGLAIVLAAGLVNLILGWYLVRTGRRHASLILVADGQHVLSDFWTSAGVVVGLLLVRLTGRLWLDPLVAGIVALNLLWTGYRLVRHAAGGLLDEEDTALLHRLTTVLGSQVGQGVIRVHHLRAMRAGRFHHVDAHLVVPEFWTVEHAHHVAEDLGARVIREAGVQGELAFHTDPCHRAYCAICDLAACPVRREAFRARPALTVEEAVRPDTAPVEQAPPPPGRPSLPPAGGRDGGHPPAP
jgi:cation diffusion facilitator family transporter